MKSIILSIFLILKIFVFSEEFNSDEKKWIEKNIGQEIEVNYINTIDGDVFAYRDSKTAEILGVYKDFFQELSEKTGISFTMNLVVREDVLERLKKEDSSIYLKLSKNDERSQKMNFGYIFHTYEIVMIGNSKIEPYFEYNLANKRIGILSRTSEENRFKEFYLHDKHIPVEVLSIDDGFKRLEAGEIDYFLGKAEYLRDTDRYVASLSKVERGNFSMGISKEYPELFSIIEKNMESFKEEKLLESIRSHRISYFKESIVNHPDYKTVKEKYTSLKVLLSNEGYYMPFYYHNNGEYYGYLPEFYKTIGKILDIPVEFVRNGVDSSGKTKDYHIKAMDINSFTGEWDYHKFYRGRVAIVGRIDGDFILDIQNLKKYRVGMKNPVGETRERFKDGVEIFSYEQAIKDLSKNKLDYVVGDFKILSSLISNYHLGNKVKIAGYLPMEIFVTAKIQDGNEELSNILRTIGKPFLGEDHIIDEAMKKAPIVTPDHGKNMIFIGILLSTTIAFIFHHSKMRTEGDKRENMLNSLVESFEMANYYSDEDTGNHIVRINRYAKIMAEKVGCSRNFTKDISKYSSLHDVGKIGIPENILKKPGKLTDEEREEMKKHVDIGYNLTKKMGAGTMAENIARFHHERWDGVGYLMGLKGEEIPLEARIVALVDVYDALRQKRVYKEGFSHEKSIEIIKEDSGKAFDPELVDVFIVNSFLFDEVFKNYI